MTHDSTPFLPPRGESAGQPGRDGAQLRELARKLASVPLVVTGGGGFLGLSLLMELEQAGISCDVLELHAPKPEIVAQVKLERARFHSVDLTKKEELLRIAPLLPQRFVLLHMASLVSTRSEIDDAAVRQIDCEAAMANNLVEVFDRRIAYLCFTSSIEAFGPLVRLPADEDHPEHPDRIYGLNKLLVEQLFLAASRRLGFHVSNLRVGHVYGPLEHITSKTHEARAKRVIPSFLRAALEGKPITIVGDGSDLRDYVHSSDVVQAVFRAVLQNAHGTFIIAAGQSVSIREVAELAKGMAGTSVELTFRPRQGGGLNYRFSIDKARRELGFEPQVTLADGLTDEAAWMQRVGLYV